MNRPDPVSFAEASYVLAFVSSGILALTLLLGILPFQALRSFQHILWFALFTSAIGTFLGFAARRDFEQEPASEEIMNKAKIGFRTNRAILILMAIIALIAIVGALGVFTFFRI